MSKNAWIPKTCSHLTITFMSSEMGCMVTNLTLITKIIMSLRMGAAPICGDKIIFYEKLIVFVIVIF